MNFTTAIDDEAEEVTFVYDDSIVLKVSKLDDEDFVYSNFDKIEDECDGLVEILKQLAVDLLTIA